MRARTTITAILGATLLLGATMLPGRAPGASAQAPLSPADTLELLHAGRRSIWMALGEITAMNGLQWAFDYGVQRKPVFEISPRTVADNFGKTPEWDTNTFTMNQFAHPYNGALYYQVARSEGFRPVEASLFALAGSLEWEYVWETVCPAANDMVNTTVGGITLGESFSRLSASVRANRGGGLLGVAQGLFAGILDPGGSLNRGVFGGTTPSAFLDPRIATRVRLGASTGPVSDARALGQPVPVGGTRGVLRVDVEYGDRFASRRPSFFDDFELGFQLSGGTDMPSLDELRVRGNLAAGPRDREGKAWSASYLDLEFEITRNPAYALGAQTLNASYRYRFVPGGTWEIRARADARLLPIAAMSSEHAWESLHVKGISSEPSGEVQRTYDYGSGIGGQLEGSLRRDGRELLGVSYGTTWIRTFSGADGQHRVQDLRIRGTLPVSGRLAVTVGWEMQTRASDYDDYAPVSRTSSAVSVGITIGAI
jgi:hypothetical protein